MILTLDVGNTNMTGGVFKDDEIVATFRMTTKIPPVIFVFPTSNVKIIGLFLLVKTFS